MQINIETGNPDELFDVLLLSFIAFYYNFSLNIIYELMIIFFHKCLMSKKKNKLEFF